MREDGVLYYLLGDHLGSTGIVTFENGNLVSQTKYKAWGEVRHQSGPSLTEYTYTGQFSYTGSFGLMFYNARWYDPALGRFAQADSIVPPGVQGLDRYAYVNNSPMNYVDPSGHICVESDGDSDVGMAGNCHGGSNPKYQPGLQGPSWQKGERNWNLDDWKNFQETAAHCSEIPFLCSTSATGDFPINEISPDVPSKTRETGYCGGGPNVAYNGFDCLANLTQDGALVVNIPFALLEIGLMGILCWGGLESCGGALSVSHKIFVVPNVVETNLSTYSMVFSIGADLTDEKDLFSESTATAVATWGTGLISRDPVVDLVLDGYGSMYNHGHASDIVQLFMAVYSNP